MDDPGHAPCDGQGERPQGRVVGQVQVQYVGLDAFDGPAKGTAEAHGYGRIDQIELDGHTLQPWRVIQLWIAMDQGICIYSLAPLLVYEVGKKDFHAASVGREEFADVKYAQGHGGQRLLRRLRLCGSRAQLIADLPVLRILRLQAYCLVQTLQCFR